MSIPVHRVCQPAHLEVAVVVVIHTSLLRLWVSHWLLPGVDLHLDRELMDLDLDLDRYRQVLVDLVALVVCYLEDLMGLMIRNRMEVVLLDRVVYRIRP